MTIWTTIRPSDIKQVYDRVVCLLEKTVVNMPISDHKSNIVTYRIGWHQKIGEAKVGDVATGQSILLLKYCRCQYHDLVKLTNTLRESQYRRSTDDNRYGAWSFLTARDTPTVDATVWPLLGLIAAGEPMESEAVLAARNWVINNMNDDGGWGPRKGLTSRTYHTFLACFCLREIDLNYFVNNELLATKIRGWIIKCRNDDGGWGMTKGAPSSSIHTAFAVYTLFVVNAGKTPEMRTGIDYLYQHWRPDTLWEHTLSSEQYEIPRAGEWEDAINRPLVDYFVTAKVAYILLSVEESALRKEIYTSVAWLIKSQNLDGSWTLRNLVPNRMWAVQDAVLAINEFKSRFVTPQSIERMIFVRGFVIGTYESMIKKLSWMIASVILATLLTGLIIGSFLGPSTLLGQLLLSYWSWIFLAVYVVGATSLAMLREITWKQAVTGVIIPTILAIIQAYLR